MGSFSRTGHGTILHGLAYGWIQRFLDYGAPSSHLIQGRTVPRIWTWHAAQRCQTPTTLLTRSMYCTVQHVRDMICRLSDSRMAFVPSPHACITLILHASCPYSIFMLMLM